MTDLVAFLHARLDEDERLACAVEASVGTHRAGEPFDDGSGTADNDAFPSYPWGAEASELPFMAGPGHPARVLADVKAKRAVLDLFDQLAHPADVNANPPSPYAVGKAAGLAIAVRHLVSAYANHPDFDPAWGL